MYLGSFGSVDTNEDGFSAVHNQQLSAETDASATATPKVDRGSVHRHILMQDFMCQPAV